VFLIRNYFYSAVPDEFTESALIDGANQFNDLYTNLYSGRQGGLITVGLFYALITGTMLTLADV
jgi:ABC-type glycerol-3-phosphate transport system permease component